MNQPHFEPLEVSVKKKTVRERNKAWLDHQATPFAERIGIYNCSVRARLEGHYWLFCKFKREYPIEKGQLSAISAYVLQYRASHGIKYAISHTVGFFHFMVTRGKHYPDLRIHALNRALVNDHAKILVDFLTAAQDDLEQALTEAMEKIDSADFLQTKTKTQISQTPSTPPPLVNVTNIKQNFQHVVDVQNVLIIQRKYQNHFHFQNILTEGAKGKAAGVFSKRQILMLFRLLSDATTLEKIDPKKVNKFEAIADFLHAITGKSKESLIELLNDYRNQDIFAAHAAGQRDQLIRELTNLSNKCEAAGFSSLGVAANKIIHELQKKGYLE